MRIKSNLLLLIFLTGFVILLLAGAFFLGLPVERILYWLVFCHWVVLCLFFKLSSKKSLLTVIILYIFAAIFGLIGLEKISEFIFRISVIGLTVGCSLAFLDYAISDRSVNNRK